MTGRETGVRSLPMRVAMLGALWGWTAVALSGCGSSCEQLADQFCGTCADLTSGGAGNLEVACLCVSQGNLTAAAAPEGFFTSDEDAAIACDILRLDLRYVGEDEAQICKVGLALLTDGAPATCEDVSIPAFNL